MKTPMANKVSQRPVVGHRYRLVTVEELEVIEEQAGGRSDEAARLADALIEIRGATKSRRVLDIVHHALDEGT